jgi:hypothetical protein
MRLIALLWAFAASGCATTQVSAVEAQILQTAKEITAEYCSQQSVHGCAFGLGPRKGGGWTVVADPIYYTKEGKRIYGIDVERFVLFDGNGRFERVLFVP